MVDIILLNAFLLVALWTAMTTRLIKSIVGLALTSVVLSVLMFRLGSPLAGVFELSVCAGLISVVFITAVCFTDRMTKKEYAIEKQKRLSRYWYLLVVLAAVGFWLGKVKPEIPVPPTLPEAETDVRYLLWGLRRLDLLGQIVILLCGAFGVVAFFREKK